MSKNIAEYVYGKSYLSEAYADIDDLALVNQSLKNIVRKLDITDHMAINDLGSSINDMVEERRSLMDDTEFCLIDASIESLNLKKSTTDNDNLSVFVGYTSYLSTINENMKPHADRMALNVISLLPGVPIINNALSQPSVSVVIDRPTILINFKSDEEPLNEYDESEIMFTGEMQVNTINGSEALTFKKENLINMLVGSSAINSYLNNLRSEKYVYLRRHYFELKTALQTLYKSSAEADDLKGQIYLTNSY